MTDGRTRFADDQTLKDLAAVTLERDEWRQACLGHGEKAEAAERERDQLRAKLAEYEKWSGSFEAEAEKIDVAMRSQFSAARQEIIRCHLSSAYARGAAEEREACAKIAENRHKVWNDGDCIRDGEGLPAVTCDITACENIALAKSFAISP